MSNYICRGRRKTLSAKSCLITLEVNAVSFTFISKLASCHDAAYRATEVALRLARRSGATRALIHTTPLVANQMNRVWQTRKKGMKARRAACLRAAGNMKVRYV